MEKLKITTETALLLNERVLTDDNVEYHISTSTYKQKGKRVLAEMVVDAYVDGEWEHELSCAYHIGDIAKAEEDKWLKLI